MQIELVRNLVLELDDRGTEYSQPFALAGYNAVQLDTVVHRLTGTSVEVTLEGSVDNNNYDPVSGSTETHSSEGYHQGSKRAGLAATHYRLELQLNGSTGDIGIVSVTVNLTRTS